MAVLITGGTGLVGRALARRFDDVIITSRRDIPGAMRWPLDENSPPPTQPIDYVFHLAGEPVGEGRWTDDRMAAIRDSRVDGTRNLVRWLATLEHKPKALICASAIGFYGDRGDEILTETSDPAETFLARVCVDWEREAMVAEEHGIRAACARIGIVLSREGGALARMLTPFKWGVGGPLGPGTQWMSWIHLEDVVGLLCHAAEAGLSGPFNVVAPNPAPNKEFSSTFGSVIGRPAFMPAPTFALRLILGKMSDIVLASQRVLPDVALHSGYEFQHPHLREALESALEVRAEAS